MVRVLFWGMLLLFWAILIGVAVKNPRLWGLCVFSGLFGSLLWFKRRRFSLQITQKYLYKLRRN
jgi:hypothetical protein